MLVDRRSGTLQRAVDRRHRRLENICDFPGLPAEHVAEDQHRTLATRKLLDRAQQRQLHTLAHGVPRDGVVCLRGRFIGMAIRERVDRLGTARPALELVEARIGSDPIEPGLKLHSGVKPLERSPGAQ